MVRISVKKSVCFSICIWTGLVLLVFNFQAEANFSNYNSILIGDQAAGMGGAATAMTEDAAAVAWYNPAALAKLEGQSFSAAVGIYKKFDTRYLDDSDLTKASLKVNQGFFRALPSSTGSVIRPKQSSLLNDWTLALSILVPEYETFKGDIFTDTEGASSSTLNLTTESIWVGGAMARRIDADNSVGFTLYYTARNVSKTVNDRTFVSSSQSQIFTEEKNFTQNAVVGILGWHQDVSENFKWGASFRLPSLHVAGKGELTQTLVSNGSIGTPISLRDLDSKAHIPWKLSLGIAWVSPEDSKWAFDLTVYEALAYDDVEDHPSISEKIEHRNVVNGSLGYEKSWADWLRTRIGIFSNYSAHPNPDPEKVKGQGDHVDQAGFSANAAIRSGNIEYTFGGYYTGGRGRSVQRINQIYQVVPKVQNVFTMLVGTSYSY
jgi:hypothetical protein